MLPKKIDRERWEEGGQIDSVIENWKYETWSRIGGPEKSVKHVGSVMECVHSLPGICVHVWGERRRCFEETTRGKGGAAWLLLVQVLHFSGLADRREHDGPLHWAELPLQWWREWCLPEILCVSVWPYGATHAHTCLSFELWTIVFESL